MQLPLLASLDLRGTQKLVTDTILSRLAKECPLLEEVVLANMSSLTREEGVITMLHQLPRLRVLDLCGLAVVGDNSLRALATSCPLLEELDISCTSVTEVGHVVTLLLYAPSNFSLRRLLRQLLTFQSLSTLFLCLYSQARYANSSPVFFCISRNPIISVQSNIFNAYLVSKPTNLETAVITKCPQFRSELLLRLFNIFVAKNLDVFTIQSSVSQLRRHKATA